jgi:hypothetical protein
LVNAAARHRSSDASTKFLIEAIDRDTEQLARPAKDCDHTDGPYVFRLGSAGLDPASCLFKPEIYSVVRPTARVIG